MSLDDIRRSVPTDKGWTIHEHNGFIHIYDGSSPHPIIRIDPPDTVTKYDHIHFYDRFNDSLDVNGNIVSKKSPDAHIPWLGK
ncbi:transposase [Streptococcus cuniculi]|uniref:Transposase n=2 Tax=Streptococcus cuniculi TaxID=1432788 RepID=A0A4Y9J7X6_9STRE|nr:transposase [Streptococcus cuniculi]TFU97133.1 transposase [Streptococcus cuniculi]